MRGLIADWLKQVMELVGLKFKNSRERSSKLALSKQSIPNHLNPSYLILNGIDGAACLRQIADSISCLSAVQEDDSTLKKLTGCRTSLLDDISNLVRHSADCISTREQQLMAEIHALKQEVGDFKRKSSLA